MNVKEVAMALPKVGIMTFGDARTHEWENYFKNLTEPRHQQAVEYFKGLPIDLCFHPKVARLKEEIDQQVDELKAKGVESFIAHVPCWTSPNLVVRGVQRMNLSTALVSNRNASTHGTVGLLCAGGTLDQIGFDHLRIKEDFENSDGVAKRALPFIRAASTAARLKGKIFGLFGGRSLGIDTGLFDPMQWKRMFGVDTEHIDQLEIIRRAEMVPEDRTSRMVNWLSAHVDCISYDQKGLVPPKLSFQIRCYLATKDITREMGLDFVALKCMPDLSTHYVPQCLTAGFLPSPYDAEGIKEPTPMACEADADAALTLEILKQISGGSPGLFGDVSHIDYRTQTLYIPNCGGMCTWFACRAKDPSENLKRIQIRPAMRPGGGGMTYFTCAPGPVTLARLYRRAGEYRMAILPGEGVELSQEEQDEFVKARGRHQLPTAFVKVQADLDRFVEEFGSNHICAVAGIHVHDLEHLCRILHIRPVVMDR